MRTVFGVVKLWGYGLALVVTVAAGQTLPVPQPIYSLTASAIPSAAGGTPCSTASTSSALRVSAIR